MIMQPDFQKIGNILREKREQKGLSIIEISDKLCIRKSLVKALEDGNLALLPHEVYIRGYLKKYAELLDINEDTLDLDPPAKEPAVLQAEIAFRNSAPQKPAQIHG